MVKIRLSSLTYEVLQNIVRIYDETVGGHGSYGFCLFDWGQAVKQFQAGRGVDWRIGSRMTIHSKLRMRIHDSSPLRGEPFICFRFDANADIRSKKDEKLASDLKTKFEDAVDEFLKGQELAVAD